MQRRATSQTWGGEDYTAFRHALFRLTIAGELSGYLSVKADVVETIVGPVWRRRVGEATLIADWTVWWTDDHLKVLPAHRKHPADDGIERDTDASGLVSELMSGTVDIRGVVYEATRVDPVTEPQAWADWYAYLD